MGGGSHGRLEKLRIPKSGKLFRSVFRLFSGARTPPPGGTGRSSPPQAPKFFEEARRRRRSEAFFVLPKQCRAQLPLFLPHPGWLRGRARARALPCSCTASLARGHCAHGPRACLHTCTRARCARWQVGRWQRGAAHDHTQRVAREAQVAPRARARCGSWLSAHPYPVPSLPCLRMAPLVNAFFCPWMQTACVPPVCATISTGAQAP